MKFLFLNQTFHPDVVSTAQHLSDLAEALAKRGHEVTVVTSHRAYDDPTKLFEKSETWRGIKIKRIATTSFGKAAKWRRAVDFGSFIVMCCVRLLTLPRPDVVVALTSPPLISFIGACYARLRGTKFVYWVMDLNPDEAIAAGWLREDSLAARTLHALSRFSFRQAEKIIALDRFMQRRIEEKGIAPGKIVVIPPWSHNDTVQFDHGGREAFRRMHGLKDKFVVMYSGNHSPCHSLDTLLAAAKNMAEDPRFTFLFVGGGSEFKCVRQFADDHGLKNVLCLPYQPLSQLSASLSAADLQVVVMGDSFVGTIHPCKIYNALSVGAPILYIGPTRSHLNEVLDALQSEVCGAVRHGDAEYCVAQIQRIAGQGHRGEVECYPDVSARFSQRLLLPQIVAALESGRLNGKTRGIFLSRGSGENGLRKSKFEPS